MVNYYGATPVILADDASGGNVSGAKPVYLVNANGTPASLSATFASAAPAANDLTAKLPDHGRAPSSFILEAAPTSTTTLAGDDFAGTAAASLVGRTSDLGTTAAWTVVSGTWQIDGAGNVAPTTATDGYLATLPLPTVNANAYTVQVSAPYRISAATANNPGLVFRYVDANNYWFIRPQPVAGYITICQVVAGVLTDKTRTAFPGGTVDGTVLTYRVDVWQSDITLWVNGVEQVTYTSPTTGLGSAIVGLRQGIVGGYATPVKFSALTVTTYKGVKYNFPRLGETASAQVVDRGPFGSWDQTDINNPNVVWDPNNARWILYYSGYSNKDTVPVQGLGLAYASTLAGPWAKDSRNPLVTKANGNVENGALVWTAGRWLRATENTQTSTSNWQTSPDLVTWTNLTPTGLAIGVHDPFLRMNQNGLLELWYGSGMPNASIYRATSTDGGITWNAPTTPVLGPPPIGVGTYRGNGEPSVYALPGKEGTEMVVLSDVSEISGKSVICAAITTDGGTTWHWRNVAGGSGSGFDSYQKFDSYPIYAEGALHVFHSAATVAGTDVNLNTTIGHLASAWSPNPRSFRTFPASVFTNTVVPTVTGTVQGSTLTVSTGTWSVVPDSYTYQWTQNGTAISGATGSTYVIAAGDVGQAITCLVTAIKAGYSVAQVVPNYVVPAGAGVTSWSVADTFNRADSTTGLGATSTGGQTWQEVHGTWGIVSNQAKNVGGTANSQALIETLTADHTVQVTCVSGVDSGAGILFRATGGADLTLGMLLNTGALYTRSATGVFTQQTLTAVGGGSAAWTGSGEVMSIALAGTSGTVSKNGTVVATFANSLTGTRAGLRADSAAPIWDSFSVVPSPPPVPNTVAPAITGTPTLGSTLSVSTGTWSATPDSYTYQWTQNGAAISGATSNTYVITTADVATTITCTITATKVGYTTTQVTANSVTATFAGIYDRFNRANSTTSLGSTENGGPAWTIATGTWGIIGNQAYAPTAGIAVVDMGSANHTAQLQIVTRDGGSALIIRYTDANNWLGLFGASGSVTTLLRNVAGSANPVTVTGTNVFANGDVLKVSMSGSTGTIYRNGVQVSTFTDSTTGTKVGMQLSTSGRLDNFFASAP